MTITVPPTVPTGQYLLYVQFSETDCPNNVTETTEFTLTVTAAQNFTITLEQDQISLTQGVTDTVKINVNKDAGFDESISFSANSISGITAYFQPDVISPAVNETDLIVTTDASITPGDYQLIVTGTGLTNGYESKDTLLITVTGSSGLWEDVTPAGTPVLYEVFFVDEINGFAVGNSGTILNSQDGGQSWLPQTSGTGEDLFGVYFLTADFGFAVGRTGTILKTTNGGTNWDAKTAGTSTIFSDVFIFEDSTIWIAGQDRLRYSSDDGETWTPSGFFGDITTLWFNSQDDGVAFSNSGTVVQSTTDGGNTWQISQSVSDNLYDVYFFDSQSGFACGGAGALYSTNDGGNSWSSGNLGISENFYGIDFYNSTGYTVGSQGTVFRYENGWLIEDTGFLLQSLEGVAVLNDTNVIAVGSAPGNEGKILRRK